MDPASCLSHHFLPQLLLPHSLRCVSHPSPHTTSSSLSLWPLGYLLPVTGLACTYCLLTSIYFAYFLTGSLCFYPALGLPCSLHWDQRSLLCSTKGIQMSQQRLSSYLSSMLAVGPPPSSARPLLPPAGLGRYCALLHRPGELKMARTDGSYTQMDPPQCILASAGTLLLSMIFFL